MINFIIKHHNSLWTHLCFIKNSILLKNYFQLTSQPTYTSFLSYMYIYIFFRIYIYKYLHYIKYNNTQHTVNLHFIHVNIIILSFLNNFKTRCHCACILFTIFYVTIIYVTKLVFFQLPKMNVYYLYTVIIIFIKYLQYLKTDM